MNRYDLQERTLKYGLDVFAFYRSLPEGEVKSIFGKQLVRCSSSVGANYRAACRAKSSPDFIHKLKIVEEEADESLFWLEFIERTEAIHASQVSGLKEECNELVSIFVSSIKTMQNKSIIKNESKVKSPNSKIK